MEHYEVEHFAEKDLKALNVTCLKPFEIMKCVEWELEAYVNDSFYKGMRNTTKIHRAYDCIFGWIKEHKEFRTDYTTPKNVLQELRSIRRAAFYVVYAMKHLHEVK